VADRHGFAEEIRFAIHLCMEEALANVILHGYRNEPGHPIVIRSSVSGGTLFFAIDDKAPPFVPVNPDPPSEATKPASLESIEPGGNGIRLLYRFAGSLAHETLPDGNRLTIGFPVPSTGVSA
jgi:anti-sigma regulatory factor (Ser/Thr protein kinase)